MGGRRGIRETKKLERGGPGDTSRTRGARIPGHHIYAGSQCFMRGVVGCEGYVRIARAIESSTPLCAGRSNLGGGFGVSHVERDRELTSRSGLGASSRRCMRSSIVACNARSCSSSAVLTPTRESMSLA